MQITQKKCLEKRTKTEKQNKDNNTRFLEVSNIRSVEGEGNERRFILSFSSEEPYERWFGMEVLDHKEGAIDLTRLNSIGCVLFNHKRDEVIGKVIRAWVENERGQAEIEFDTDEESEKIYQKVKSGTLKGVSVGYIVDSWEEVAVNKQSSDGRFKGPASIAVKWAPYEISIVSVPADPTVGVGRSHTLTEEKADYNIYEKQIQINKNLRRFEG